VSKIDLKVNGHSRTVDVEPATPHLRVPMPWPTLERPNDRLYEQYEVLWNAARDRYIPRHAT